MNNSVLWKPSDNAILSNYVFFKQLLEIGIPPESISFLPSEPNLFFKTISKSPEMAGLAFTGSSSVFEQMYKTVGNNISRYNNFPRIIGETGGMNFHFVFNDVVDIEDIAFKTVRGAFEYSGQKCSATSQFIFLIQKQTKLGKLILETMKLVIHQRKRVLLLLQ